MDNLFIFAGALFALIFMVQAFIRTFRKQLKIGFWELLLAFLGVLLPLAGVIQGSMGDQAAALPLLLSRGLGAALVVAGVVLGGIEYIRNRKLNQSRGVFATGMGLLVMVSTFTVPLTSSRVLLPALATVTPINVAQLQSSPTPGAARETETAAPTATATMTATATLTRTPRATGTPTATPYVFVTSTPPPTATLPTPCLALTRFNVNLRAAPDENAAIEQTIPFDNTVALYGHSEDEVWWYGEYEGKQGWLKAEFLVLSASCDRLPAKESD